MSPTFFFALIKYFALYRVIPSSIRHCGRNEFLGHTEEESHFFLLLVQLERAGNPSLRAYFQKQIDFILQQRSVIKTRLKDAKSLSEMDESKFYSTWLYAAVHVLTSIERLQTKEALSTYLKLPLQRVSEILEFLVSLGLVDYQRGHYVMTQAHFHLAAHSPNISKHHSNWRMQAIAALDHGNSPEHNHLHYSAVLSLSLEDSKVIREKLLQCLEENLAIVRKSPAEEGFVYSFDFFRLSRS